MRQRRRANLTVTLGFFILIAAALAIGFTIAAVPAREKRVAARVRGACIVAAAVGVVLAMLVVAGPGGAQAAAGVSAWGAAVVRAPFVVVDGHGKALMRMAADRDGGSLADLHA